MIKVAIVGTGFMAKTHLDAYKKIDNVNVVAVTAINEEKGKKFAEENDCLYLSNIESILSDKSIDVIDICTPTFTHEQLVIKSAEAGKHILCEKPISLTLESVDRMIEATENAGVIFMVGQLLRFWPEYMELKKIIDSDMLGDVHMIYANRLAQHPEWGEWFKDPAKSGGGLFDLHLHDIDFIYHVFGEVDTIYAIGKQNALGAWNHVLTNITFKNGTKAAVESSYEMPEGFPFTMTFRASGNLGTADFQFSAGVNLEDLDASESKFYVFDKKKTNIQTVKIEEIDPYNNELDYFINCIKNNKAPEKMLPKENREVLRIMLAIKNSLETGEIIKFDNLI